MQVPLGVFLKNETTYEEMMDILDMLQKYVPKVEMNATYIGDDGHIKECKIEKMHYLLLGGDQLTVARARGCQKIRSNSIALPVRLEGLQPVIEDWHEKGVFLEVSSSV